MSPVYESLSFPAPADDRPYIYINMVSTIDGKIVTGGRNEPVQDLGSATDHATMKTIQTSADAIMIGAGTLRSTPQINYPVGPYRFVVTRTASLDPFCIFFSQDPARAFVVCPIENADRVPEDAQAICIGGGEIDFDELFGIMRNEMGIVNLLVEGGSELNSELFRLGVVDEIFLTVAPKIKLGADTPTIADGVALPRSEIQEFNLLSCVRVEHELFLRYRRLGGSETRG